MEGKNAETRSRESSLVVNLVDCLLVECREGSVFGREILNLLSGLYILSPHQEITMTIWFHHTIVRQYLN
jgi:hypothetical protein